MILLGIVGTPASGKSTVATRLQSKGASWINADLIARDVLTEPDVFRQLVDHFGNSIVASSGPAEIDRAALAKLVFGDSSEKKASLNFLESIVHPITRQRITDQIRIAASENSLVAILDIPLLFESRWDRSCDAIWCIDAPLETRINWASTRGWNADELARRESNQLPIAEKRRLSSQILVNDATLEDLHKLVDDLWMDVVTIGSVVSHPPDPGHCLGD
ncbi:MAG: dephospho-CoA kinase [Pirellulaceae bacterium]